MLLHCGDKTLDLTKPQIMGILNTTPDSFSDGGNSYRGDQLDLSLALQRAESLHQQGASIIDVGGESTRPGAAVVGSAQEMDRVLPVVEAIKQDLDIIVSIDTSNPLLIEQAAKLGAGMINDVRALQRPGALIAAAKTALPVCLMHMQGKPETMQAAPQYASVVDEVSAFLAARKKAAIAAGIDASKIIFDPGFGFGKSLAHNVELMQRLGELAVAGQPLLVGLSRKSMIDGLLQRPVAQRLAGSIGLALMSLQRGASILRVHDVAETRDMVELFMAIDKSLIR